MRLALLVLGSLLLLLGLAQVAKRLPWVTPSTPTSSPATPGQPGDYVGSWQSTHPSFDLSIELQGEGLRVLGLEAGAVLFRPFDSGYRQEQGEVRRGLQLRGQELRLTSPDEPEVLLRRRQ